MIASPSEGVIKFQLDFVEGTPPPGEYLHELNAWRTIFRRLGLLGQDPLRYAGFGFGNLSRRLPGQDGSAFLISGTQTGQFESLAPEHYAIVHECDPLANRLRASGQTQPSSEALSHAILYQADTEIHWVMHLHSAEIFACRKRLALPCTEPQFAYGTPEMAGEVRRLAKTQAAHAGILVMAGHEDGILAYGRSATATGALVVNTLVLALQKG